MCGGELEVFRPTLDRLVGPRGTGRHGTLVLAGPGLPETHADGTIFLSGYGFYYF